MAEESVKIDDKMPQRIELLPHHIDIFVYIKLWGLKRWKDWMNYRYVKYPRFYYGDNNSVYKLDKETVSRMNSFFEELSWSPDTEVEIVDRPEKDFVCGLCSNLVNGACKYGYDGYKDREMRLKYNLRVGETLKIRELVSKWMEKISEEMIEEGIEGIKR